MATEPKKTRKSGPRVAKDKVVYLVFEGEVNMSTMQIHTDPEKVMDAMDANSNLKRAKVVIPAKKKPVAPVAA